MTIDSSNLVRDVLSARLWEVDFFRGLGLRRELQLAVQHALIVLLNGEASLELEDRVIRMGEGSAYLCPAGRTFGVRGHASEEVTVAVFHFSLYFADPSQKETMHEVADVMEMLHENKIGSMSPRRLHTICRKVYMLAHQEEPVRRWRAQLDFQEMLYELVSGGANDSSMDKAEALERAKAMIEERYAEELTIDRLAEVAGFSVNYFADMFKKTYDRSVMDYVTQVRMNKAKQLMLGSESLLREIAHAVGYRDEFYFSRKFKKEFGLSPTAYMKIKRNKIALYGSTALLGYMTPLEMIPFAAPLHPKWSAEYHTLALEIPVHLDAYRQNHNKADNLAKLEEVQPDRIICIKELDLWEKEKLRQIAPVYELSLETEDWQGELRQLAFELDRTEEAEQWLKAFTRNISRQQQLVSQGLQNASVIALRVCGQRLTCNHSRAVQEVLVHLLGCRLSDLPGGMNSEVTMNDLNSAEAENMLVLVRQDSETLAFWKQLSASPEWLSLRPVRTGRVHTISSYPWREYSPMAIERMVERAVKILTGKNP
ncbi:AraC family transcriptional regulator [Paenibacillus chibensis]|uniref:AraC family transcriptional regulator n=1 Tax=Paenibacillus chibensis TaxID=59846 RepID=UPI003D2956A5